MTSEQQSAAREMYVWRGHSISRIAEVLGLEIADVALFIDPDYMIEPEPKKKRRKKRRKPPDILDGVLSEVVADRATRARG